MHSYLQRTLFALICCGILAFGFAEAQTPLEAMLYNSETGEIILVNQTGTQLERMALPAVGSQTFSPTIAISDSGNRIAYVLTDTNSNAKDLMIYDRTQDTIIGQYRIPVQRDDNVYHSLDFRGRSSPFDATTNRFALGYSVNYQDWHLVIFDITQDEVSSSIDHVSVADLPGNAGGTDLPMPRQFNGEFVDFTLIATGTEGFPTYPAYRWNVQNNDIVQNPVFRDLNSDFLLEEHILSVPDYSFPNINDQIESPFAQINTLYASPLDTEPAFPVYYSQNLTFLRPRFIENGRRVAIHSTDALTDTQTGWHVINRAGELLGTLGIGALSPHELIGTPRGLLYSASVTDIQQATGEIINHNADTTALMYIDTTQSFDNTIGTVLWSGENNQFPELVWVSDRQSSAFTMPSIWTQLDTAPNIIENPCSTQPDLCDLSVGMQAEIHTTEGDLLNLRSGASTDFDIIDQLPNGEIVELLEGPISNESFSWWRIQTQTNQTGWVVERVDGIQVLLALQIPEQAQPAGLTVGEPARVTVEGDNLNAHTEPALNAPILSILHQGDVVEVLGGPAQADGFTWWQVETPEGDAWVVDGDNGELWLVPSER